MFYIIGEYAWPGVNVLFHALAFAIVVLSSAGAYAIVKETKGGKGGTF